MKIDIEQLCESVGVKTPCDYFDGGEVWINAYDAAYDYAKSLGLEGEAARERAEADAEKEESRIFDAYVGAVVQAAQKLYDAHGLMIVEGEKYTYTVKPKVSWKDAAAQVIETINGVGYFHFGSVGEFLRSGPYTPKQAVTSHLHWLKRYPDVYGGDCAPRYAIERTMRYV